MMVNTYDNIDFVALDICGSIRKFDLKTFNIKNIIIYLKVYLLLMYL